MRRGKKSEAARGAVLCRASEVLPGLLVICAVVLAGCGGGGGASSPPPRVESPRPARDPVPVTVAPVVSRPARRTLEFVGTLYGAQEVTLSSRAAGQLASVVADLGDRVTRGQVLGEIDSAALRARLRVAEATLAQALAEERRGRTLLERHVISRSEYDARKTAVAVAEARRDELRVSLADTVIHSPIAGSVARRLISAGEYVRQGTAMFELVADDLLKLRGGLPERFAGELAVGQSVQISVDAYPHEVFPGRLSRVSPVADRKNRSIAVEATIANSRQRLKPGFFTVARIVIRNDEQALFVPEGAVQRFAGLTRVFVVRNGVARRVSVRTGSRGGDGSVEITDGLFADEMVVIAGFSKLADGAPVRTLTPSGVAE